MKFDYTRGQSANYMVSIYSWNLNVHYYFHYYKDAKKIFDDLKNSEWEKGTSINLSDMKKDIKKEFVKF